MRGVGCDGVPEGKWEGGEVSHPSKKLQSG